MRATNFFASLLILVLGVFTLSPPAWADNGEKEENKASGSTPASFLQPAPYPLRPLSNRWRMLDAHGVQVPPGSILDPYNQNVLKGDFPIIGLNTFMVLTAFYTPVGVFNSLENVDSQFNNQAVGDLEFFHGTTVFRPKDWSIRGTVAGLFNRGQADLEDFGLRQLFGEIKLFDVGPYYDFTSFRGGVQFFKSDFNGFIFQDFNLGGVLFGELAANRYRWTLAYFSQRQKENGLVRFDKLNQDVFVASLVAEDILRLGFIGEFSVHYNRDRQISGADVDVLYLGFASAGHWGRVVLNPTFYLVVGSQNELRTLETGPELVRLEQDVLAFLAGLEFAYPNDFLNYRAALFVASGDNDPDDDKANGFDSILDNVNLFGGNTSFVVGGGQFGTRPNSFIPSFRGLATRSTFNNPGILAANLGLDVVLTPKLFFEANANYFQFLKLVQDKPLGFEVNGRLAYRLALNENLVFNLGANAFFPLNGAEPFLGNKDVVLAGNVNVLFLF